MGILLIQAGGTVDKDYPQGEGNHGYAFKIGDPAFLSILERGKFTGNWRNVDAVRKDSLDMDDEDRALLLRIITQNEIRRVIITHGTDTIKKTAGFLSGVEGRTIVLTGAMHPEKYRDTDADFNLGMAVGATLLPSGVYIALGDVYPWEEFES